MKKVKTLLSLFLTMFKIGLFTFGGGYAMISVIERDVVEKKKWLDHQEYLSVIAIAESTPGPLAINTATYVGNKVCGFWGALFSTLGVILPSFVIILVISLFFDKFLQIEWVNYAFRGIQAAVAFLIVSAGIRMLKSLKINAFNIIMFCVSIIALVLLTIFAINFSTIYFILIGGAIGLIVFSVLNKRKKSSEAQAVKKEEQFSEEEKNSFKGGEK